MHVLLGNTISGSICPKHRKPLPPGGDNERKLATLSCVKRLTCWKQSPSEWSNTPTFLPLLLLYFFSAFPTPCFSSPFMKITCEIPSFSSSRTISSPSHRNPETLRTPPAPTRLAHPPTETQRTPAAPLLPALALPALK